jgi:hypothetical protein
MESVRIYLEDYDQKLLKRFPEGLYDVRSNMTFEELLMMSETEMTEQAKNSFIGQTKNYEKLGEFLNIVADCCPSEVAVELIHAAQQIFAEFTASEHKDNPFVESSALLELALTKCRSLTGISLLDLSVIPRVG